MSELALDDQQRDALARHLTGVRVAQLMGREPSSHPGRSGFVMQLGTDAGRASRPSAGRTAQDAEQGTNRELAAQCEPRRELPAGPAVHPDLPAFGALAMRTRIAPLPASRSLSANASASLIRRPARANTTSGPRSLVPSGSSPAARITAMISSTVGGSAGYREPLLAWRATTVIFRHSRRRAGTAGGVHERARWHEVLPQTMVDPPIVSSRRGPATASPTARLLFAQSASHHRHPLQPQPGT